MRNRFDRQLLRLNQEMIDMGSLCEEMITAAAKIVATRDKELMDDIVTMEEEINQKEKGYRTYLYETSDAATASGKRSACYLSSYEDGI